MTMQWSGATEPRESRPLARCLIDLADTPDDAAGVRAQLVTVALLVADRVEAADYASVTTLDGDGYATVAASSELARAVDDAQYSSDAGPCLDSVDTGTPVAVPDIRNAIRWPGFREQAIAMGLRASLSIPLFAGSGATLAALNLYGRDHTSMGVLIDAVLTVFDDRSGDEPLPAALDDGGRELVAGLVEAHTIRATIQRAIGVTMGRENCTAEQAYRRLQASAAAAGVTLRETATGLLAERR
ncbi:GAF and ANTAR domain-containing protein [Actinoplanes xinjiangensis]|uniref:GAF domain-containing protein n=1 Tax=Actinoplanes xinjiangensis TaxID=512350 RepID=A0A316EFQ1_9ACTN|nr:GAF and ANTAR domain-containing protein [Actinoplanes xinjiangensis]PWK30178.1 GAF domain-containing protein [Actinoplanes xinjiangensis]GIF44606.1 transcription antitermination regulator [Actinoplanes xinjiangensis]